MRWLKDIRVDPSPNKNIAELQDITIERFDARWRYETFITLKQKKAADKYYGLWTYARGHRTWKAAAPAGQSAKRLPYDPAKLTDFSRAARRDEDTVAACGMLLEYMEQRDVKWLWREAAASMGRYVHHIDNMVLFSFAPSASNEDAWVDALRVGLDLLDAFFAVKRKLDYEACCLGDLNVADANQRITAADAGRKLADAEAFGDREEAGFAVGSRAA